MVRARDLQPGAECRVLAWKESAVGAVESYEIVEKHAFAAAASRFSLCLRLSDNSADGTSALADLRFQAISAVLEERRD
jgi:hypothetical protein